MFLPTHHYFLEALFIYGSHHITGAPCIPFESWMLPDSVAWVQTHETIHIYEETCAGAVCLSVCHEHHTGVGNRICQGG
jgi:hypothetical protein